MDFEISNNAPTSDALRKGACARFGGSFKPMLVFA